MSKSVQVEAQAQGWYVYIVQCADASLYTGIATDVRRRIAEHNNGSGARYTRARLPVQLVHVESTPDRSTALRREYQIKQMSTSRKRALIGNCGANADRGESR